MTQTTEVPPGFLADRQALLDVQLQVLSERVHEAGRQSDRQITACVTFAALTVLIVFGGSDILTLFGIELDNTVAASVTYILTCGYYCRANLTAHALSLWRQTLRELRELRYSSILDVAKTISEVNLLATRKDIGSYIPEYPGFLLTSAYTKDHAVSRSDALGRFVFLLNRITIILFSLLPHLLAVALLVHAGGSVSSLAVVVLGTSLTLCGNAYLHLSLRPHGAANHDG